MDVAHIMNKGGFPLSKIRCKQLRSMRALICYDFEAKYFATKK